MSATRPDNSAMPAAHRPGPDLPLAQEGPIAFGGFAFEPGPAPQSGGLLALTRRIGGKIYPLIFVEGADLAAEHQALLAREPGLAKGLADGVYWSLRENARMRSHVLRELIGKYDPPLNEQHRKARAAPEVAALVEDRGQNLPEEGGFEPIEVTEQEIRALVEAFYAEAREDEMIGPVFSSHVSDWPHHFDIVQNFWSRALLGTQRYKGTPFAPHLGLNLKPEFFDRWLMLFRKHAEAQLKPAAARFILSRAEHMKESFEAGLFPLHMGGKKTSGKADA